jgi:prophage regulatory protein
MKDGQLEQAPKVRPSAVRPEIFDPDATLIRVPEVSAITGLGRTSIYELMKKDPTFPRPVKLGESRSRTTPTAFVLGEVQKWVRAKIATRDNS